MSSDSSPLPSSRPDPETIRRIIAASRPEDYQGRTEFDRLSPRARLAWLDAAVVFIAEQRQRRELTVREDRPDAGPPGKA